MNNTHNRLNICPVCGDGRLDADRHPYTAESGFIYRARKCRECGAEIYTKQGPEEFTGAPLMRGIQI